MGRNAAETRRGVRAEIALAAKEAAAGRAREANAAAETALQRAMALDDQWLLGRALTTAAESLLGLQRPQEALPLAEEAEQIFAGIRRAAAKPQRLQATRLTARCLDALGRGPEALTRYEFAIAEFAELPAHRSWSWTTAHAEARAATVSLLRQTGRAGEAVEEAIGSINFWSRRRHPHAQRWRCLLYYELARSLETTGELEGAAEAAEMGIAETTRLGTEPDRVATLQTLRGSILILLGEQAKGEHLLTQAVNHAWSGQAPPTGENEQAYDNPQSGPPGPAEGGQAGRAEQPTQAVPATEAAAAGDGGAEGDDGGRAQLREGLAQLVDGYASKPGAPEALGAWAVRFRVVPRPAEDGEPGADQKPVRPEP